MIETENGAKTMENLREHTSPSRRADMDEEDEDYHRGIRTACAGDQTACAVKKGEPRC